ncbi:radical SAM protein [Cryptosporangium phraense]|uniref:Radical SAM protein n=1 Tax=Cryptosporangium phraense TaxID=2593070 RepID=A0A545AZK9_9ACTN|nr:radical SAM protein [Cryptosporangium phraense]TQS46766.1 radical SAM protein [Cryptosporangium phraense]
MTGEPVWRPAVLATATGDGRVRCDLCPHACVLADGEIGECRVRRNSGGRLETATFTTTVAHLDAVERKPFFHVRPGSQVLTAAGPGCSFRCNYCVNHRLSQYGRPGGSSDFAGDPAQPSTLVSQAADAGAAIGLSYAEPSLAPELTLALAGLAAPRGVPVLWKTNGFLTAAAIDLVAPVLTAVNVDVKAATDAAHRRLTGAPLAPVLDAIERFRAAGVWVEVCTPLIPGVSDAPAEARAIAANLAAIDPAVPWHLVRFTPDFRMRRPDPTPPAVLARAAADGREAGLTFVYVERALGDQGRATYCPACGVVLVDRTLWASRENHLVDGRCPGCGLAIPGRWA